MLFVVVFCFFVPVVMVVVVVVLVSVVIGGGVFVSGVCWCIVLLVCVFLIIWCWDGFFALVLHCVSATQ